MHRSDELEATADIQNGEKQKTALGAFRPFMGPNFDGQEWVGT